MSGQNYGVNVTDFGADPSGLADSTTAFEGAISTVSGRGGIVFVPQGTYTISRTLHLPDFVSLRGESRSTTLDFSTQQDGSAILISGFGNLEVERLQIWNPAGNGIDIRKTDANENRNFCHVRDVVVRDERSDIDRGTRGGSGFFVQNAYLTSFERCMASNMRDFGFYFAGFHTTIKLDTCEASGCKKTGYFLIKMIYSILTNCGSDSNEGYGYFLANCQSVTLTSCGAEKSHLSSIGMAASDAWANDWNAGELGELRGITINSFCSIDGNQSGDSNFGHYMTLSAEDHKSIEGSSLNHFVLRGKGEEVIRREGGSARIDFPVWQGSRKLS
jgi:hypothetical protein